MKGPQPLAGLKHPSSIYLGKLLISVQCEVVGVLCFLCEVLGGMCCG
ncbi:MAG: hypothetical protein RL497_475 [Pseudomonadota bacterium]|jgi:hypothetical protein